MCQSPFGCTVTRSEASPPVSDLAKENLRAPQNVGSPCAVLIESVNSPGEKTVGVESSRPTFYVAR